MMTFVARRLEARGIRAHLASPGHLRWQDGRAWLEAAWWRGPLDLVVRFFPAEWLGALPKASGWRSLFAGSRTPISNPATALVTQSKRFPLVWGELSTPLPAWRAPCGAVADVTRLDPQAGARPRRRGHRHQRPDGCG
jgi:hypothetical protein